MQQARFIGVVLNTLQLSDSKHNVNEIMHANITRSQTRIPKFDNLAK
jgi:hypothetical protein